MSVQIKITIPGNPVSWNALYGAGKRGFSYLTSEGKAWKEQVAWIARIAYKGEPLDCRLRVEIECYFKNKVRRDLDNVTKALGDSLTGIIYRDDSLIDELIVRRHYDKDSPRVELTICTLDS